MIALAREMCRLAPGDLFEVRTTGPGAEADLPVWARLAGHAFEGAMPTLRLSRRFLIRKGSPGASA